MPNPRRFPVVLAVLVAACASPAPASLVPLLAEAPSQPYELVARLEARGDPGEPIEYAYDELRWKANALGADAVVKTEARALVDRTPPTTPPPERPLLGNAYPAPLRSLEPGAFPEAGRDLKVSGQYFVVEGLAIRYRD